MEATRMSDVGFKAMVIRMLKDLMGRMNDPNENLNKDIVNTRKDIETIKRN